MLSPTNVSVGIVLPGASSDRVDSGSGSPHIRKPTGRWCLLGLQVFRVPVTGFVAVVEGALAVQQDTHVVTGVVTPPHAHSSRSVGRRCSTTAIDRSDPYKSRSETRRVDDVHTHFLTIPSNSARQARSVLRRLRLHTGLPTNGIRDPGRRVAECGRGRASRQGHSSKWRTWASSRP